MVPSSPTARADRRIDGSFRDPSGYVFEHRGRIYRAIDERCQQTLQALADQGLLTDLMAQGLLVQTRFVTGTAERTELSVEHPGYRHFLEHDRISPITYPYEWSVSMLADAALHTLDLQEALAGVGFALKDASAYNIQFQDGRPTFIDLGSIERPRRQDIWYALGQFGRMFTFPLLLFRYHGWDLRSYFLASLDGRDVEQVSRGFSWWERWRPRSLLDITLPRLLGRRAQRSASTNQAILDKTDTDNRSQLLQLQRLRSKITKLAAGYRPTEGWSNYTNTCSYSHQAESAKKELVQRFFQKVQPRCVFDAGCNTGDYSFIAAECGARVVAADASHDTVELLYRRLRDKPAPITPVIVDLANPSPAIGFRNRERPAFLSRLNADCMLALALIHHLLVSANLSLEAIRDFFGELTERDLVLEFVPLHDPMFQTLLRFRENLCAGLTLESCRAVFEKRFELLNQVDIPGSPRTLLFYRKKA